MKQKFFNEKEAFFTATNEKILFAILGLAVVALIAQMVYKLITNDLLF